MEGTSKVIRPEKTGSIHLPSCPENCLELDSAIMHINFVPSTSTFLFVRREGRIRRKRPRTILNQTWNTSHSLWCIPGHRRCHLLTVKKNLFPVETAVWTASDGLTSRLKTTTPIATPKPHGRGPKRVHGVYSGVFANPKASWWCFFGPMDGGHGFFEVRYCWRTRREKEFLTVLTFRELRVKQPGKIDHASCKPANCTNPVPG